MLSVAMMSQQTQPLSFENTNILLNNTSEVNKQQGNKAKRPSLPPLVLFPAFKISENRRMQYLTLVSLHLPAKAILIRTFILKAPFLDCARMFCLLISFENMKCPKVFWHQ